MSRYIIISLLLRLFYLIYTDLPAPVVNIGGSPVIDRTGGEDFNLTCIVTVVEYLIVEPTVQWSGGSVGSGNGVMVGDTVTTHSGVMSMRTLTFSPLCTSHEGDYFCRATINTSLINEKTDLAFAYVIVHSPSE